MSDIIRYFIKKIGDNNKRCMKGLFILITAFISGIFAGMGMGGGTFLIPALSLFFSYNQAICQSTNVVCFILLGFLCILIYGRNKLIEPKIVLSVSIPACLVSILFTVFSIKLSSGILKYCFAGFIICFGIYYFISTIIQIKKKKSS